VSCSRSINTATTFLVYRVGETVADHSEEGAEEPTAPEIRAALRAMDADGPLEAAFDDTRELLCRTAGIRPTVADVTGTAKWVITPALE
jgi:hypothetical protein